MDRVKALAYFLINNASAYMGTYEEALQDRPLPEPWEQAMAEANQFRDSQLSDKERRILFRDYKNTRGAFIDKGNPWRAFITKSFRKDMTRDEIWQTAEGIVSGWLGEPGIETKG